MVANGAADLGAKLSTFIDRIDRNERSFGFPQGVHFGNRVSLPGGRIAFMFPGQGSQRVGMVEEISLGYPGAMSLWEAADAALAGRMPQPLSHHVYPSADSSANTEAALKETDVAQPAMGVADAVLGHVLADLGVEPDMCVGHSYGEYAALHAAGALGFEELVVLSQARGRAIWEASRDTPGAMLAVGAPSEVVEGLIGATDDAVVANLNGPAQTVVSGREEDIERVLARCSEHSLRAVTLHVATAFHSPLVESAQGPLRNALGRTRLSPPKVPVYANTTGEPHSSDPKSIREELVDQLTMPVRFADCIANMRRDGARIFIEVGPGNVLSSLAANNLQGSDAVVIAIDHRDGWFGLLNAAARLFVLGASRPVERLQGLFDGTERPTQERQSEGRRRRLGNGPRQLANLAMARHQRLMRLFVENQEAAMMRFLGAVALDERLLPPVESPASRSAVLGDQPRARNEDAGSSVGWGVGLHPGTDGQALERLRNMVADLTGFPPDMLDADLDLEVDLGIDSIKRVEILVEAQGRFPQLADALDEEGKRVFSQLTTLSQMAEFLESVGTGPVVSIRRAADGEQAESEEGGTACAVEATPETAPRDNDGAGLVPHEGDPTRRVPLLVPAPVEPVGPRHRPGAGTVVVASDGRGVAEALARQLPAHLNLLVLEGLSVGPNDAGTRLRELKSVAGYIHLGMLSAGPLTLEQLRKRADAARRDLVGFAANLKVLAAPLRSSGGFVVVAAPFGLGPGGDDGEGSLDPLAGGHLGLLKSVAREWPETRCRAVDLRVGLRGDETAAIIVDELLAEDDSVEVVYRGSHRHVVVLTDSNPADGHSKAPLREGDVVVATGGARGITGEAVVAMAERWRPRLVLVGRTALVGEHPLYVGLSDMAGLKRQIAIVLGESGEAPNAALIEQEYRSLVRRREIRRNLRRVREAGAEAEYVVADVGDQATFRRVLADVHQRHGRIDGVVHGAGIREDRLLVDKNLDSFERVLRPKVDGVLALVASLDLDRLKVLCFFSSTAARYGSAGQSDYAAANEVLNSLARWLCAKTSTHVVSLNWGPWVPGVGMVDETMARRFRRRGVAMIPRRLGIEAFLAEVASRAKGEAEVVYE